jgi:hypothetical protein
MKASIEVENRNEAKAITTGLEDPATRAFVVVMGALAALPSDRARKRVLQYVTDYLDEQREQANADYTEQHRGTAASDGGT